MSELNNQPEIVCSHNEWDPLEEVIVGVLDGAVTVPWEISLEAIVPEINRGPARLHHMAKAGSMVPKDYLDEAKEELEGLVTTLEDNGVKVRRPEVINWDRNFGTPEWASPGGNCQANPRDVIIVIGNEIIEATMSWRSRYFESLAYRKLIKEYFHSGAKWSAAPKPALSSMSYDPNWQSNNGYVITEHEPLFDAADITRCGKDLFVQISNTTNYFAIEWLKRHLGERYNVHSIQFHDDRAIHIDATFVPLCPGKILTNPDRPVRALPKIIAESDWELIPAPRSTYPSDSPHYEAFHWLSINILNLDEKRILVEANELPLIEQLDNLGFEPIPVKFRKNYEFGGSFHCATVDIRRRGKLQSYF